MKPYDPNKRPVVGDLVIEQWIVPSDEKIMTYQYKVIETNESYIKMKTVYITDNGNDQIPYYLIPWNEFHRIVNQTGNRLWWHVKPEGSLPNELFQI